MGWPIECIRKDDDIQHLTMVSIHFKPPQLEGDHPRREIDNRKGKAIVEVPHEEDEVPK